METIIKNQYESFDSEEKITSVINALRECIDNYANPPKDTTAGYWHKKVIEFPRWVSNALKNGFEYIDKTKEELEQERIDQLEQEKLIRRNELLLSAKNGDSEAKDKLLREAWDNAGYTMQKAQEYLIRKIRDGKEDSDYISEIENIRTQIVDEINSA